MVHILKSRYVNQVSWTLAPYKIHKNHFIHVQAAHIIIVNAFLIWSNLRSCFQSNPINVYNQSFFRVLEISWYYYHKHFSQNNGENFSINDNATQFRLILLRKYSNDRNWNFLTARFPWGKIYIELIKHIPQWSFLIYKQNVNIFLFSWKQYRYIKSQKAGFITNKIFSKLIPIYALNQRPSLVIYPRVLGLFFIYYFMTSYADLRWPPIHNHACPFTVQWSIYQYKTAVSDVTDALLRVLTIVNARKNTTNYIPLCKIDTYLILRTTSR